MKQFTFEKKWQKFWNNYANNLILISEGDDYANYDSFPADYRRICQQLSLARTRCYSLALCERLEKLVFDGHNQLYGNQKTPWLKIANYLFIDFPITVRKHKVAFYSSLFFFLVPAIIVGIICYFDHSFIYSILPSSNVEQFERMYSNQVDFLGQIRESDTDWKMFGYYIKNNIGISFEVFAGGILAGIGSLFYLFYNGILLGSISTHLTLAGMGANFWSFVCSHSAFELTAIVISGQAGLMLAFALIKPGNASRKDRLMETGREAAIIISGTTIMLIIAAILEAFWSSSTSYEHYVKYSVAAVLWFGVIVFFLFSGRGYKLTQDQQYQAVKLQRDSFDEN